MKYIIYLFCIATLSVNAQQNIFDAARHGSVEEVKTLMKTDSNIINQKNENGHTPLILATYKGNNEVALFLVDHVKDINDKSADGTALMAAVVADNKDVVKALLNKKADVNYADNSGVTALLYATMFSNADLVALLINAGADTNAKDVRGHSAHDYAKMTKQDKILQLLNN